MDSLISAAARALANGDVLGALQRVSLRDDPTALALRGTAMAQLGEYPRARELLRRAARGFGAHDALARARCVVAAAEVALAMRDLGASPRPLAAAEAILKAHDDHANALQAQLIAVRRLVLLGRLHEAAAALAPLDLRGLSPAQAAVAQLTAAELALRSMHIDVARQALAAAHDAATRARVPALLAEVAEAQATLDRPAARRTDPDGAHLLRLDEVAALLATDALVIDACRRGLSVGNTRLPLARRPVLFVLAHALGAAWPGDVDRETLIERAFGVRHPDASYRARLRVEIGRLRALVNALARVEPTSRGFVLRPLARRTVVVLEPPISGGQAALMALLGDGAPWSTSALALALGTSQRSVQRALAALEAAGRVRAIGRARSQRWLAPPLVGFTTILLLPVALPSG